MENPNHGTVKGSIFTMRIKTKCSECSENIDVAHYCSLCARQFCVECFLKHAKEYTEKGKSCLCNKDCEGNKYGNN